MKSLFDSTGSSAVIDPTGIYRYRLERELKSDGSVACVCMLNPSTADASIDDPTIGRLKAILRTRGFCRMIVVNAFAFRATDPRALRTAVDPVGPENDAHILSAAKECDTFIAAWGNHATLRGRDQIVRNMVRRVCPVWAFKITKQDQPYHPLYLPTDVGLQIWHSKVVANG